MKNQSTYCTLNIALLIIAMFILIETGFSQTNLESAQITPKSRNPFEGNEKDKEMNRRDAMISNLQRLYHSYASFETANTVKLQPALLEDVDILLLTINNKVDPLKIFLRQKSLDASGGKLVCTVNGSILYQRMDQTIVEVPPIDYSTLSAKYRAKFLRCLHTTVDVYTSQHAGQTPSSLSALKELWTTRPPIGIPQDWVKLSESCEMIFNKFPPEYWIIREIKDDESGCRLQCRQNGKIMFNYQGSCTEDFSEMESLYEQQQVKQKQEKLRFSIEKLESSSDSPELQLTTSILNELRMIDGAKDQYAL
jgi:hypothetical protein